MKILATLLLAAFATVACAKEEPKKEQPKQEEVKPAAPAENNNCVKKDRDGKCPPLPSSPRPTPKAPA